MSADTETLKIYGAQAQEYADLTDGAGDDPLLETFIAALPQGGTVLDLGCGPGTASARMAAAGLKVQATDAVPEMVTLAATHLGVTAQVATFDDIGGTDLYDGIWANFSLLHAPRTEMPRHLSALRQALKPGGLFHIGLKTGTDEKRDALGRLYTYYTADELHSLLKAANLTPFSSHTGCDKGMDGTMADWIVITAHG